MQIITYLKRQKNIFTFTSLSILLVGFFFFASQAQRQQVSNSKAASTADEIHYTFISDTSVSIDWRGASGALAYGPTTSYGKTATGTPPSIGPYSSSGPFWEAKITGLSSNTLYHYSIGGGSDHTFKTGHSKGDQSAFTVAAYADVGETVAYPNSGIIQGMIATLHPDMTLLAGDITYANAHGQAAVDNHFNDVMPWSTNGTAYMPAWGNHEWDEAGDNLKNYKGRFDLPNAQTSPGSPAVSCCGKDWYWFDYGNTRFITFPEPWSGAWADWNAKVKTVMDQAQADPGIKYIVTYGHRPALSSGHHPGDATLLGYINALGDTHSKYVLNINGHSHNYERSTPQHGVIHLTVGTGGGNLEEDPPCQWKTCTQPSWSAKRLMREGLTKLVFTATGIQGNFLCGPAGGGANDIQCNQGAVVDSFTIGTPSSPGPQPTGAPSPVPTAVANPTNPAPGNPSPVGPTSVPTPTDTPTPTPIPSATIGPLINDMQVVASIKIPGIGTDGNKSPLHQTRRVQLNIFDVNNNQVGTGTGFLIWDKVNSFTGPIHLGKFNEGVYYVKVVSDNALQKLVSPQFQTLTGGNNVLPPATILLGDLDQDNTLTINDYNLALTCFQDSACPTRTQLDFNDDGKVDVQDYNLFLHNFWTFSGE